MNDPGIVKRYAAAFLKEAKDRHLVQRLYTETQTLNEMLRAQPKLMTVLEAPHIDVKQKIGLIERVFKTRLTPLLLNVIMLLAIKHRADYLADILEDYRRMVDHERGIFEANVTTARELAFLEKLQLKTALEKFTGHKLNVEYKIDPAIIGGMIFKYQDYYIDASARGQLTRLRQQLEAVDVIK